MSFSVDHHFDYSKIFNGGDVLNTLEPIEVISAIIDKLKNYYSSSYYIKCLDIIKKEFVSKLTLFSVFFANNTPLSIVETVIPKVFVSLHINGVNEDDLSMVFLIIKDIKAMSKLMLANGYSAEQACAVHFRQPHASGHSVEYCM